MGDTTPAGRPGTRRWLAGAAVVVTVMAVMAVIAVLPDDHAGVTLPEPDGVSAQWIGERPVFVVRDADGSVRVLDAISPHSPEGFVKVLAWCDSSQWFEDLWHGSAFDRTGAYLGGPAPTGMAAYVSSVGDGTIQVGSLRSPPERSAGTKVPAAGPRCDERTALYGLGHPADPAVLDDVTVHDTPGSVTDLWIPTPNRILGTVPTHFCSDATADTPEGLCSVSPSGTT